MRILFQSTGEAEVDQIITVLLRTNMLIGGMIAFILDNTIPGTPEERGITVWRQNTEHGGKRIHVYDLPFGLRKLSTYRFAKYLPFLPYYPDGNVYSAEVELKQVSTTAPAYDVEE